MMQQDITCANDITFKTLQDSGLFSSPLSFYVIVEEKLNLIDANVVFQLYSDILYSHFRLIELLFVINVNTE